MQLTFEVNAHMMIQLCAHSVLWDTSRTKIKTADVESERLVVWYSQCLVKWDNEYKRLLRSQCTRKEHYYTYISNSSNLHLAIFLQQLMDCTHTCAYYIRPCLPIIKFLCARHTLVVLWSSCSSIKILVAYHVDIYCVFADVAMFETSFAGHVLFL